MSDTDIDDVLELIGFGYMQLFMVFTCAMIIVYVNNQLMGIGLLSVALSCDLSISDPQISVLSVAAIVGLILSSVYAGYKTDRVGRRTMIIYSLMLSLTTSVISALMPEFYSLVFWRFMTGLLISGAGVNHFTYITEYTKISARPRMVNFMYYFVTLCSMYVPAMASLMKPLKLALWSFGPYKVYVWRFSFLANCFPGVLALIGMWFLPETAKFMLSVGDTEGAYRTLDRLCQIKHKRNLQSFGVTGVTQTKGDRAVESKYFLQRLFSEFRVLLNKPYLLVIIQVTIIMSALNAVGFGFGLWFTKMRHYLSEEKLVFCEGLDFCNQRNESGDDYHCLVKPMYYTDGIILSFSTFCCLLFAAFLLFFLSRRIVLTIYTFCATMCGLSLNVVKEHTLQLMCQVLFIALCNSSMPLAGSVMMDVVPTHLRGSAAALTHMFARLAIVVTSLLLAQMICEYCELFLNLLVDFLFVASALSFFLPV